VKLTDAKYEVENIQEEKRAKVREDDMVIWSSILLYCCSTGFAAMPGLRCGGVMGAVFFKRSSLNLESPRETFTKKNFIKSLSLNS
jgi:hypothetical protein